MTLPVAELTVTTAPDMGGHGAIHHIMYATAEEAEADYTRLKAVLEVDKYERRNGSAVVELIGLGGKNTLKASELNSISLSILAEAYAVSVALTEAYPRLERAVTKGGDSDA